MTGRESHGYGADSHDEFSYGNGDSHDWDYEADVVAVGAGPAGLACAIAAAAGDLEIVVARPASAVQSGHDDDVHGWLPRLDDPATADYFDALSAELPTADAPDLATSEVYRVERAEPNRRRPIDTFVGSRLWDWAATCLGSPFGVLFTRVDYWPTVPMRSTDGTAVDVAVLGEVATPGRTLGDFLDEMADDRGIEISEECTLQRLVFGEDGWVDGVVLDTPEGAWAVRARIGVAITGTQAVPAEQRLDAGDRIGLVGRRAGRFGRLEVLREVEPPPAT
ncbi:FAD-binding protein [Mycolicibacterium neoaurum]|uniref:FAD-binding protein n=1 Tax=Mycolicibacterium neoaurum TaxID=1795 RepID=UPI00267319A3|nr:FAD-binding protein [Mycolicibacterium neoaurum]MDO3401949.1 FAD-binding protein [Mycolicibacterium neoaurum]